MIERHDYVFNANDSFWVPNATHFIAGDYSPLHGLQNTVRSWRTRENAMVLDDTSPSGPSGADGKFTLDEVTRRGPVERGEHGPASSRRRWSPPVGATAGGHRRRAHGST